MAKKVKLITTWRPSLMGMMATIELLADFKVEYTEPHMTPKDRFQEKNFFRGLNNKRK